MWWVHFPVDCPVVKVPFLLFFTSWVAPTSEGNTSSKCGDLVTFISLNLSGHFFTLFTLYFLALISADAQHRKWMLSLNHTLGVTYQKLGNPWKSIQCYEKAKELLESEFSADPEELQTICNNLGNAYQSTEVSLGMYSSGIQMKTEILSRWFH